MTKSATQSPKSEEPNPQKHSDLISNSQSLIFLLIFITAFIPRVLWLDIYVAPDEGKWIFRSAHFLKALITGDLAQASSVAATPDVEVLAPAVPTMWTGALGLVLKYWVDGVETDLLTFLNAIPTDTEKISLGFYPWTRLPTVLLTSVAVLLFYWLLTKLVSQRIALFAALLLALDPFFIGLSRVIHHDALVSIFILLSLLGILIYRQHLSRDWLLFSAIAGGLALATKPTALYLVIFVGVFLLFGPSVGRQLPFAQRFRQALLEGITWGAIAFITFVAIWPAMWVAPIDTLADLVTRATRAVDNQNNYAFIPAAGDPLPDLGFLFYPVNWLFKTTLPVMIGLVILLIVRPRRTNDVNQPPQYGMTCWFLTFVLLFLVLLIPADTRDVRYFLPAVPALYILATIGVFTLADRLTIPKFYLLSGSILSVQLALTLTYAPYFVDYWNPAFGGPWLAPRLVKIGSGEGIDQVGRYLSQKPNAERLTVATSFWESFVPYFPGNYTKAHYDEEADYILIYRRQVQNRNPFPEYWTYFSAREPEQTVSLLGLEYAWLYPGPQLQVVRDGDFGEGIQLLGYRLPQWAAEPGETVDLTFVWAETDMDSQNVTVQIRDAADQVWAKSTGAMLTPDASSSVEGQFALSFPAEIPRGDYNVWISVDGRDAKNVGTLPVRTLTQPAVEIDTSAKFGEFITLVGGALSTTTISPDQPLDLMYIWQPQQRIPFEYTSFTHLVDAEGTKWGQVDRVPANVSTLDWDEGEWLIDRFQLTLKPDTPPGEYTLLVGVYHAQTFERLPVVSEPGGDVIEFGTITVP